MIPNPARVLLVDDETSVLKVVSGLLVDAGYTVICANSEKEALGQLECEKFDLVLTDMRMETDSSGLNVLKKSKQKAIDTEVIVMTVYEATSDAVQCIKAGAFNYFVKDPMGEIAFDQLMRLVEDSLLHKSLRRALVTHYQIVQAVSDKLKNATALLQQCVEELGRIKPPNQIGSRQ